MKQKLIQLKDRLNDLSKRNRSIRMLKLYDKWAFDISSIDHLNQKINAKTILDQVMDQKGNLVLVKQDRVQVLSLVGCTGLVQFSRCPVKRRRFRCSSAIGIQTCRSLGLADQSL